MRFTLLNILTVTVSLTASFRFTPSMPDGVYSVYTAANGTEVHDLIVPDNSTTDASGNPISIPSQARALHALSARSILFLLAPSLPVAAESAWTTTTPTRPIRISKRPFPRARPCHQGDRFLLKREALLSSFAITIAATLRRGRKRQSVVPVRLRGLVDRILRELSAWMDIHIWSIGTWVTGMTLVRMRRIQISGTVEQ